MRFPSCGKIAYIPAKEAEMEAERMKVEDGYEYAYAYECGVRSKKGTVHFHVTSGRTRWEHEQEERRR